MVVRKPNPSPTYPIVCRVSADTHQLRVRLQEKLKIPLSVLVPKALQVLERSLERTEAA